MSSEIPLLKTQQVAEAFGVSVSTVKRWVNAGALAASLTPGKHRLISRSEAKRFAKCHGLDVGGFDDVQPRPTSLKVAINEQLVDELVDDLQRDQAHAVRQLIRAAYVEGQGAVALADELIRPVMSRIGEHWSSGTLDVYQEHRATQLITAALADLIDRQRDDLSSEAPVALGCTPEGDPYTLSLQLGELTLCEKGWDVRNLGPNLSFAELDRAVRKYRPGLVFLSVNVVSEREGFVRGYMDFYQTAKQYGVAVVLGGHGIEPEIRDRLIFAGFGNRMAHLAEFARQLNVRTLDPPAMGRTP